MSRTQTVAFFLKGCKRYFAIGVICSLLVAFLDMIGPKIVQYSVDSVLGDEVPASGPASGLIAFCGGREYLRTHLYLIALAVIVIAVLAAVCRYMYRVFNSKGAEKFIQRMRNELFDHILRLPLSWHEHNHTGDIIQRCTSDVETIKNFLSEQLMGLFRVAILIALGMYFMIGINPKLACISGVFIPIIILYSVFFHNKIASSFRHADEEEGKLSSIAQENLTGVRVVRAFGREEYERKRFKTQNHGYTQMWIRLMMWLSAFWCSNDFITGLQIMLVTVFGAISCVQGKMSVGQYIAFASYNGILSWPVRELGRVISDMSKAGISVDRIKYIMDSKTEDDISGRAETVVLPDEPRDICFEHVSFSYEENVEVLNDVSFTVPAGSTLGILGSTGSGKSTLMQLLSKLYELPAECGRITIGGEDIRNIDRNSLRRHVGLVLQEPFLFSGTLAENIEMGTLDKSDMDRVRHAAHVAALDETVERFSEGYKTYVGERGVTLSGGQKQRTAIAQVIASDTPVMIFDDSLSAVDTKTDMRIRANLRESTAEATVILISHRIATLMQCDNIIVLDRGKLIAQGNHDELVNNCELYRRIVEIQMAGAAV